jgi:hypothetical protein
MHVMPGDSLAHLLPAAFRVALGLPAVAAGSDASGGSSDSEEEGEDGRNGYRRRRGDSHRQRGEEEGASGDFAGDMGESKPLGYDGRKEEGTHQEILFPSAWGKWNVLTQFPKLTHLHRRYHPSPRCLETLPPLSSFKLLMVVRFRLSRCAMQMQKTDASHTR